MKAHPVAQTALELAKHYGDVGETAKALGMRISEPRRMCSLTPEHNDVQREQIEFAVDQTERIVREA